MIRVEDFGEIAFGGLVTVSAWWDNKRIDEGRLATKDILKKASFYSYLGVGLIATLMSVFGWMRRYERWAEHISHGFLYDLPRFAFDLSKSLGASGRGSGSAAVREAQRIIQQRQLGAAGVRETARSYEREFDSVGAF